MTRTEEILNYANSFKGKGMENEELKENIRLAIIDGAMWADKHPITDNNIEYIRKDAFIEKARKWFEKRNEWRDINGIKHCDMESFEDFRKYMEK